MADDAGCHAEIVLKQDLPELPAGLDDARNLALESKAAEAHAADAELAQKRARAAAELAAVVLAGLELRFASVFDALCSGCHVLSLLLLLDAVLF